MIPLAVPNLNGNEQLYLDRCIETTFVSSVGEYVNQFEEMVADATGSKHAVATASGTTGLHAALTAVGVKYDELVIIPSFTFIATANSVAHCGAMPWLMDVSEHDWCLNPSIVRSELEKNTERRNGSIFHRELGKRVAAIMPVYTLGNIPDMREFCKVANEYGLPLVVDAACAIGATFEGESFGKLADMSVLSFNGNKTVTCGGGGAVVGDDEEMLAHVRHLTTTARVWPDYDFDEVGFNYRMTNVQAAIGCAQMEKLSSFVERKRQVSNFYAREFADEAYDMFKRTKGSSCWFSGIVLKSGSTLADAKGVCERLHEKGIEAKPFWKPIHLQKPYLKCLKGDMSVTEALWQRIVTLPCSTGITDEELNEVVCEVKSLS